jgi:polygalacturonase/uncharacterized protein YjdB
MKNLILLLYFGLFLPAFLFSREQATNITFNAIPDGIHPVTDRYVLKANDVILPVVNGYNQQSGQNGRGYLNYDYTTFSASAGKVTITLQAKEKINSIKISPLKLNIPVNKVDDYTYTFEIPEPQGDEQYYNIAEINGRRLVIARDPEETNVPVAGNQGVFSVTDRLGAVNPTVMDNAVAVAAAFQAAVDDASAYGTANNTQGIVLIPAGLYYMGNLMLKSNTALYLAPGSVLMFTDNMEDYSNDFRKQSLNRDGTWWIYTAENSSNIKIYGRGTIDGNGHWLQKNCPSDRRFSSHLLLVMGTDNFVFDGPILKEASFWGTVLARSSNVTFRNVKILHSMDANENDGIDVCESQHVLVEKAIGIALDDPFSTKTWTQSTDICPNWYGSPEPLEDVTFKNCVSLTYCGAFKLGHGAMQKQTGIVVKNGVVIDCGRAIGIEPKYGDGSATKGFENMTFENIDIEGAGGEGWLKILCERPNVGHPPLKNILLKDIHIRAKGSTSSLMGYDENNIVDGITFDNITMYENATPVTNLTELNILKTGFYQNLLFTQAGEARPAIYRIQAEYANVLKSIDIVKSTDPENTSGSQLSSLNNTDYLVYRNVDFGSKTGNIRFRLFAIESFQMELWLDRQIANDGSLIGGTKIASPAISTTGSWLNTDVPFTDLNGTHDLYIVFPHNNYNPLGYLNWLELTREFKDIEGIALPASPVNLSVGQSIALVPLFTPANAYDKSVNWNIQSESASGVVSVDEKGIVRALASGTAVVRVTSLANASLSASITIEVTSNPLFDTRRIPAGEVDVLFGKDWEGKTGINLSGENLNGLWQNNYAIFNNIDFGDYTSNIKIRYCVPRESYIELWIDRKIASDGTLYEGVFIGEKNIKTTDMSWSKWEEFDIPVIMASGVHNLSLEFSAYGSTTSDQQFGTINWLELTRYFSAEMESIHPVEQELSLSIGESKEIGFTVSPAGTANQTLLWTIENESAPGVISLSNQTVKGIIPGTAQIKITYAYNPAVFATVDVTVGANGEMDVFRLEAESATAIYDTYHYDGAIAIGNINDPEDVGGRGINNCWNTNFAVYKDIDFKSNTIKATIRKGYPRGSKLELWVDRVINETAKTATGGTLIGSVEFPSAATDWNRWQTFETEISGASGVHDLTLMFLAGGGSATNQNYGALNWIEFTRITENATEIKAIKLIDTQVYINPTTNELSIKSETPIEFVRISNVNGQVIYQNNHLNQKELNVSNVNWTPGLYIIQTGNKQNITNKKIIINK